MTSVRSIRRNMEREQKPPAAVSPSATPAPTDPLQGRDYRVRRIILRAELDVYNKEGVLTERGLTDDLVIMEADFPQPLMAYFIGRGMLKEGFKTYKPPTPPKPETPPQE